MVDPPKRISWLQLSVVGGLTLSLVTLLIGAPFKIAAYLFQHKSEPIAWGELIGFPFLIFGMGFLCGSVVWALQGLSRRLGLLGDAITGLVVMNVFFLSCMLIFDRAMLQGNAPGREAMLVLGSVAGLVLGGWIGRDLRRESASEHGPGKGVRNR